VISKRVVLAALTLAAIGVAWMLSPLTVLFSVAIVAIVRLGIRDLDGDERRWATTLIVVAIALRLLIIVVLFLATNHDQVPFGRFFADEEYFIKRSLWLRNVTLGISMYNFDIEYAFEPNASSSFVDLLAFVQMLAGPSPYGLHLLSIALYLSGVLLLYRAVRVTLGRMPALFGLVVLLYLPSLFAWSLSVLKEPLFVFVSALGIVLASGLARAGSWLRRAVIAFALVAVAAILQTIRAGGASFLALSTLGGLATGFVASRRRLMAATLIAVPILLGAIVRIPAVQLRLYVAAQRAARQHWGAVVVSSGYRYRLLDDRFYRDINDASSLEFKETMRFLARGVAAFLTVPRPWDSRSPAAAAYIPEQVAWYLLVILAVVGTLSGLRRDPAMTGLLVTSTVLIAAAAAFTDGNVGTLVRHRSLALPYLVWLSGAGACDLLGALHRRQSATAIEAPPALRMRPV
jgi:hypothetical protein